MAQQKFNVYQHVTDTILAELEAGTVPWHQPWSGGGGLPMPRRVTGQSYQGINVVMLWLAAVKHGYGSFGWMTYAQALKLGGQVRKGEKSSTVIKFGKITKEGSTDPVTGETEEDRHIPWARAYRVFNVEQIDGLEAQWYDRPDPPRDFGTQVDPVLEAWFAAMGVPIDHSPVPEAYYEPAKDRIHLPPIYTFETLHAYFHTLAHECSHATGVSHRLDRKHSGKTGMQRRAQEEIVAEISSAMICARLGIQPVFDQNAAYLKSWIDALRADHRAIVKAASMAQAAADWMFATAGEIDRFPEAEAGQGHPAEAA